MSRRSFSHWREFIRNSAFEVPIDNSGSLLLAETREEAKELELAARALSADKIEIEYYSRDPMGRGYHAAIEQPLDAGVQPYLLAKTVMAQSGAEVIANNELYRLEEEKGVVQVHTRKFLFKARFVMLCTNAYSPMIDPYFVGKVLPMRAQCLVTEPLDSRSRSLLRLQRLWLHVLQNHLWTGVSCSVAGASSIKAKRTTPPKTGSIPRCTPSWISISPSISPM